MVENHNTGQYTLLREGPGPVGGSQVVISDNPTLQNVPVTQHQQVQGGQQQQPMPVTTPVMVNQTGTGMAYRYQDDAAATTTVPTSSVNSAPVGNTPTTTASNTNTGTSGQVLKLFKKFNFPSISEIIIEIKIDDTVHCQSQMQKFSIHFTAASCE